MLATPSPLLPPSPPPPPVMPPVGKRRRGGQPGNQNARKFGTYSRLQPGKFAPLQAEIDRLRATRCYHGDLDAFRQEVSDTFTLLEAVPVSIKREREVVLDHQVKLGLLAADLALEVYISEAQVEFLCRIARHPMDWIQKGFKSWGISRDADSFFIVSEKSARFSPLPPDHPRLATNLTDDQWSLLQPLIPADPYGDFVCGRPPVIIAANRWGFSHYAPGDHSADLEVMREHDRILQRCPGLLGPPPGRRPRKRVYSPRALLDAVFWKLATGHTWAELPSGFPPMRTCRAYYRRLFLSGRLYTLLLALYNHMRLEMRVHPWTLYQKGLFTTTPNRRIALVPGASPTSEHYTALLFFQLARNAWTTLENDRSRDLPADLRRCLPAGCATLSDARLPVLGVKRIGPVPGAKRKGPAGCARLSDARMPDATPPDFESLPIDVLISHLPGAWSQDPVSACARTAGTGERNLSQSKSEWDKLKENPSETGYLPDTDLLERFSSGLPP